MPGAFMGKFSFLSTGSGAQYYLALADQAKGDPLAGLSSSTPVDWIAYDGGTQSGTQMLVFATLVPNPLYLYVNGSLGWTQANADLVMAQPFSIAGDGGSLVYWQDLSSGTTVQGSYDTANVFRGLIFDAAEAGVALQQITITPSLAALVANKSAAGYDFSGADLTNASFAGLDCTKAIFDGCILDGAVFTGATLTGASFVGCNLANVTWGTNPQASGADFTASIGRGVVFTSDSTAPGTQANFAGAIFTGADFSGASFAGATLDGAYTYGANFSGANLAGANLASLNGGLSGGNVGFDLSWAYMADANLLEAHLQGADLSHAQAYFLKSGKLQSAVLIDTNLAHADLTGMSLDSATIAGANFTDAVLIGCALTNVVFQPSAEGLPVLLCGAHLEGAQFTESSLTAAHLAGAYVADSNGVPLFSTAMQSAYATALNAGTLPSAFPALFAGFGCSLSATATVAPGPASGQWTLTQQPVVPALGVEITGYLLAGTSTTLTVYASQYNANEMGSSGAFGLSGLPVAATVLDPTMLDPATRCPNGATLQANQAAGLTWEQMLMSPRQPVVGS